MKKRFADGYFRRGVIYAGIALIGIGYELVFVRPLRPVVLTLWVGVLGIGVIVILNLRDPS
jgi:predicted membrane channel-forming protein YqfA (hemolysin III family)